MVEERLERRFVNSSVFDGRIREDERVRVLQALRVFRRIGNEIVVLVAVQRVELPAMLAGVSLCVSELRDGKRRKRADCVNQPIPASLHRILGMHAKDA
jgi:hypothetical protein